MCVVFIFVFCFFFKQKTAYEMRISDWSSDVCSSDLGRAPAPPAAATQWRTGKRQEFVGEEGGTPGILLARPVAGTSPRRSRVVDHDSPTSEGRMGRSERKACWPPPGPTGHDHAGRSAPSQSAASRDRKSTRLNSSH